MKKIKALFLAAVMAVAVTGCSGSGKGSDDKKGNDLSTGETAYISIGRELISLNGEFFSEGKAYKESFADSELDEESKLTGMNVFYFDNGEFTQFYYKVSSGYYSGKYDVKEDDELSLQYRSMYIESDTSGYLVDIENEKAAEEAGVSGITIKSVKKQLESANKSGYALTVPLFYNDQFNSFAPPMVKQEDYLTIGQAQSSTSGATVTLYSKGDYLVAKQYGYTFDGKADKKEFTLKYDASDCYEPPQYPKWDEHTVKFNSDNTWESDLTSASGKWELLYDNLLVVYSSHEEDDRRVMLFYLDFDEEEIYIPAYIKCDDALKCAKNFDK